MASSSRLILTLLLALMTACAANTENTIYPKSPNKQIEDIFVILPGNFIVDIAAGSSVMLNPDIQEFAVFSSRGKAFQARDKALADGRMSGTDDWRVYRIEGDFSDLAQKCGDGYCLGAPARVSDWVE